LATGVLDRLDVLTLREGLSGLQFLEQVGLLAGEHRLGPAGISTSPMLRTRGGAWLAVTGDDTLTYAVTAQPPEIRSAEALIGVNIRLSDYAEVHDDALPVFGEAMTSAARALSMNLLALPVSQYAQEADLPAVARALAHTPCETHTRLTAEQMRTPAELIRATSRCQVVVSGSYHAAVFALGQGVPVVGLSASGYYDQKFNGLRTLYPSLVEVVRLDGPDLRADLVNAVCRAASTRGDARAKGVGQSRRLVELADTAFAAFADIVEEVQERRSA